MLDLSARAVQRVPIVVAVVCREVHPVDVLIRACKEPVSYVARVAGEMYFVAGNRNKENVLLGTLF